MAMGCFLSVVVNIINVLRVAVKTENYPPVGSDSHCPKAFQLTFEPMQPKPRHIHVFNGRRGMKRSQNIPQLVNVFRVNAARIVVFKKPFQSFMPERVYRPTP
jgi:hypothetical protein